MGEMLKAPRRFTPVDAKGVKQLGEFTAMETLHTLLGGRNPEGPTIEQLVAHPKVREQFLGNLSPGVKKAVADLETQDRKNPYTAMNFVTDAYRLRQISLQREKLQEETGVTDQTKTEELARLSKESDQLFDRTVAYALPIVTTDAEKPVGKNPEADTQLHLRIMLEKARNAYLQSHKEDPERVDLAIDNILEAALELSPLGPDVRQKVRTRLWLPNESPENPPSTKYVTALQNFVKEIDASNNIDDTTDPKVREAGAKRFVSEATTVLLTPPELQNDVQKMFSQLPLPVQQAVIHELKRVENVTRDAWKDRPAVAEDLHFFIPVLSKANLALAA